MGKLAMTRSSLLLVFLGLMLMGSHLPLVVSRRYCICRLTIYTMAYTTSPKKHQRWCL